MVLRIVTPASMLLAGLASTASAEPDLANGRTIARAECARCHGEDGNARSTSFQPVPMLAGQPAVYLVKEMQNYLAEAREDTSKQKAMSRVLGHLSEKDIEDVAAYYSAQKRY